MAVTADSKWGRAGLSRGLRGIVDFAAGSHARAAALLVVVALLAFLPGFFAIPPMDRDEARFAQATKQMLESGDYVDIRFQEESRYKKPVGIYWLQAAAVKTGQLLRVREAETRIWLYRFPSLLGAIGAVLLTYWAALAFVSRRAALMAGLMMATCVLLAVESRIAKTDASLLLTAVAAMGAMARAYLPEQRAQLVGGSALLVPAVFWTALAASVLLKGPVVPLIVVLTGVTLIAIDRSARWLLALRPLLGLLWLVLLVLPWFVAITKQAGSGFYAESLGHDLFSKLFQGQESHGAPPGYYLVLFGLTFWPASILAGLAAPAVFAARREPGAKFLLAWIVPTWIVFEIVMTKLPHYVLPLYPAIAILTAGVIGAQMMSSNRWLERGTVWWFVLPVLLGILGLVVLVFVGRRFGFLAWLLCGASAVMGFRAWQLYRGDGAEHAMLRAIVAAILLFAAILGAIVPALRPVFPAATMAEIVGYSSCAKPLAVMAGYGEPSAVFLVGTATGHTDGTGAADFLQGGPCRFAFVEGRHQRSFVQRADAISLRYSLAFRFEGFNIGNGRWISIAIYRSEGAT